jgi:hypothetical protein
MKAHIPVSCKQKRQIHDEMVREYQKVAEEERKDITRRICKTMIFCLNKEFGFGLKRCARAFDSFAQHIDSSRDDEVFWEHIDRVVIDQLGLPFDRDYTDRGRVSKNPS